MFYLVASIILTSYLTLSFKVLGRKNIDSFQAIVFNYITCVITGTVVLGYFPVERSIFSASWFPWAMLMGSLFILIFNVISYSARYIGVAVTSVANKLSLVIPFAFSIYFYGEASTVVRYTGILVAVIAVILTCYPSDKSEINDPAIKKGRILIPLFLFLSSGLLDTLIKYVEQAHLTEKDQDAYLVTTFGAAALIGTTIMVGQFIIRKRRFSGAAMIAGLAIGVPNYFSIWSLLVVLKLFPADSSFIIPVNNMGIVLFSAVVAWLIFREQLSRINWLGILLSLLAIALIAFG